MDVSIIIPTYNYGEFIADALRSVERQTYVDWECLIIDDASTDATTSIVSEFVHRDPRFRYIRLEKNGGVSEARDRGFAEAHGEFIQMIDADDVIGPQKLEVQLAFLRSDPKVDLVYSDFVAFDGNPDLDASGAYRMDERLSGAGDAIVARLLRGNVFRLNTVLFRSSVLKKVGGFVTGFRYAEDWEFWLRVASKGYFFHFLDDPAAKSGVRHNPRSLSSDRESMSDHYLPVLQHVWCHADLSLEHRLGILFRYAMYMLDRIVLRKGRVIILPKGRWPFMLFVITTTGLLLPVYPFYKLQQLVR